MAEEDLSELNFCPGQLGLNLVDYDLKANLVGDALISTSDANGVHTVVCDLSEMDKKIGGKGVISSYDFGVVTFTYFCGLGTLALVDVHTYYTDDDVEKWGKFVSELKQFSELKQSNPNTELSQSLIESVEFLGEEAPKFLEWVRDAPGKTCAICDNVLRDGDEVATIVNLKIRGLACTSTNYNGLYHLWHTPCLISWMLFCDYMIKYGPRAKRDIGFLLHSVICPECEGTGVLVEEKGEFTFELPQIGSDGTAVLRAKAFNSYMEWINSASEASKKGGKVIGAHFSALPKRYTSKVKIMKSLKIYRAA